MMRKIVAATAALALVLGAASAANAAYVFNTEGQSQTIYFNGFNNNVLDTDLSAKLKLTLFDIDANGDFTFSYELSNISGGNDLGSRLVNFGFNADPNFQTASIVGPSFFDDVKSGNVVAGQPNVEFCATDANNCTGGGSAAGTLELGELGTGKFFLNFATPQTSVSLDNLQVRWISLNNGGSGYGVPTAPVPEPATWMMMIMGFLGAGAMVRRRRYEAAPSVA